MPPNGTHASVEDDLALLLCQTRQRRAHTERHIQHLASKARPETLASNWERQWLLGLAGTRLREAAPSFRDPVVDGRVDAFVERTRRPNALTGVLTLELLAELDRHEIRAVPIKGPLLGRMLYGDFGIRASYDIDLLVHAERLERAVEVAARHGHEAAPDPIGKGGLPQLHRTLKDPRRRLPDIEVHWRVHWYESDFSSSLIDQSIECGVRGRRPRPVDDLALLLLAYARDGFTGLRYLADIGAWWDVYGHSLDRYAMDELLESYPALRPSLLASIRLGERLVGLPAGFLCSSRWLQPGRDSRAVRMANWSAKGDADQVAANTGLVDFLLAPAEGRWAAVRRQLLPPAAVVDGMFSLPEGSRVRRQWARLVHFGKVSGRFAIAMWRTRGTHALGPAPERVAAESYESAAGRIERPSAA